MTKIYLDTCCLNRPFDDQTQDRVRLEAKADVYLSTDDRLLKLAKRMSKRLKIRVENPLEWVEEMI